MQTESGVSEPAREDERFYALGDSGGFVCGAETQRRVSLQEGDGSRSAHGAEAQVR